MGRYTTALLLAPCLLLAGCDRQQQAAPATDPITYHTIIETATAPRVGRPQTAAVAVTSTSGGCQAQYGFLYRQNGSSYRTIGQGPGIGATSPPAAGKHPTQ